MSYAPPTLVVLSLLFGAYTTFAGYQWIAHIGVMLLLFEYLFLLDVSQVAAIASIIILTVFFIVAKRKQMLAQWTYQGLRFIVCTGTILAVGLLVYFAFNSTIDAVVIVIFSLVTVAFTILFTLWEDRISFIASTTVLGTTIMVASLGLWNNDTLQLELWHIPFALFALLLGAAIQWKSSLLRPALQEGVLWMTPRNTDATELATPTPKSDEEVHPNHQIV
ncbi:hypothetical protein THRCLA_21252 [Thraustotheca clavata]|uniref:Uncharacterized protein n=1 Tax=Thraustotheca clavata TaxID=74557 RepID=A0A1V9ZYK9_9STRA|nr:hypothetical protein THRCLA_21252 [Thraustotheca clavata]